MHFDLECLYSKSDCTLKTEYWIRKETQAEDRDIERQKYRKQEKQEKRKEEPRKQKEP